MNFKKTLNEKELSHYLSNQINVFFPDKEKVTPKFVLPIIEHSSEHLYNCFSKIPTKHFRKNENVYFNHLQSDQYAMFLSILSRQSYLLKNDQIATKIYYLNKILHSIDVYFRTKLPEVFLFVHPLGSILGRAKFSNYFIMYQNCTVGCLNKDIFPIFMGKTIMYAYSSVLGECIIGDNVCIASGTSVINTNIPSNTIVMGEYPNYVLKENKKDFFKRPPFFYEKK